MNQHLWHRFMETKRPRAPCLLRNSVSEKDRESAACSIQVGKTVPATCLKIQGTLRPQCVRALEDERRPEPRRGHTVLGLQFEDGFQLRLPQRIGGRHRLHFFVKCL